MSGLQFAAVHVPTTSRFACSQFEPARTSAACFLGDQDTLFADYGRQLYLDTYIKGGVAFIFGNATAVFWHSIPRAGRFWKRTDAAPQAFYAECNNTGPAKPHFPAFFGRINSPQSKWRPSHQPTSSREMTGGTD